MRNYCDRRAISVVLIIAVSLALLICAAVFAVVSATVSAADSEDWRETPVISHVYEVDKEKISLEWEGKADLYQVYVDSKKVKTVNINTAIIDLKPGLRQITVVPVHYESKNADTNVDIKIAGIVDGSIDLESLGVDPKDLLRGNPSAPFKINYTANPFFTAVPGIIGAETGFDDCVRLSFTDKYDADIYKIAIRSGKDTNYIEYDPGDEEAAAFITKENADVSILLDKEYLATRGCFAPELDQKYGFSVKLQKWPKDLTDGAEAKDFILESKESKEFSYTPYAAWKNAPEITYASQTADGQILLRWAHEDNGLGCKYRIVRYNIKFGVKKEESEAGQTGEKEFVIKDLLNGKYTYVVVPVLADEQGNASEEAEVEVRNDWVAAPAVECTPGGPGQAVLRWISPPEIESYHVAVSAGSGSLLRFVNLDYKKYSEFDIEAQPGQMEYVFTYEDEIDPEAGVKLKFEVYGVRHAADGTEQKSAETAQTIVIK